MFSLSSEFSIGTTAIHSGYILILEQTPATTGPNASRLPNLLVRQPTARPALKHAAESGACGTHPIN
jgi:hypothetical protein